MNLYDFSLLADHEQINVLYKDGVFIGKRKLGNETVILYQVESFYVEIFYRKYRCFIAKINCFTSVDLIAPYLSQVNVAELLNV